LFRSQGPTSNAFASFDSNFDLTIDYSNTPFAGMDELTIEVCDLLGACSQIILQIQVDGEIRAFNGISPNGDGDNDYFLIQNIQFLEPQNKVSIYNRWGDLIFDIENYDSTNPDKRFNGVSNKDKELSSGVYFYKIEFQSDREGLNGYLTLKK
ncbi:MAG: gliding motility-associated C-terminal domain-containing protein, partial [Cyclobacteriaceae bacterium]